jgi:putative transport protein
VEQAFEASSKLASAYAAAYPLGVLVPILLLIVFKSLMRIDIDKEKQAAGKGDDGANAYRMACTVANPALTGKTLGDVLRDNRDLHFVVSRLLRDGQVMFPEMDQVLDQGDKLLIVTDNRHKETVRLIFGQESPVDMREWQRDGIKLVARRLSITKSSITGKTLRGMDIRHRYGVNVTRILRSGVELQADGDLILQVGDVITVVGFEDGIAQLAKEVGNRPEDLRKPNLAVIFLGIALGVVVGLIPIRFPSMPQPLRLGLAGGPLIVAILLSYFGPKLHITTYTALSANLMIREVGISLFTAAVGLGAGETFVSSLASGGYIWILYGLAITVIPLLITAIVARRILKLDFFKICGLLSGAGTNPPMLSFAEQTYGNGRIAVNYATVYPLAMFLRVIAAQVMIMLMF